VNSYGLSTSSSQLQLIDNILRVFTHFSSSVSFQPKTLVKRMEYTMAANKIAKSETNENMILKEFSCYKGISLCGFTR